MIPQKLNNIKDFLIENQLSLSQNSRDGRIDSAFNEDEVFNFIAKKFDIIYPKKRDWFDFAFEENNIFYPVNIKITNLSIDNLNCKLGVYYALTGKLLHFDNEIRWANLFEALKENLESNTRDYYFLVINKQDKKDIFATCLKSLNSLVPNGNNLPFQANWAKNKTLVSRTYDEAKDFILGTLAKSLYQRAKAYDEFLDFFPEFKQ
ncbi:restriction endonuclease [Helicobacter sp. CLO-3]|uniref:restriction endonuclease n=1 Tax=unclassified Helicobacter TaxID=2593540 RepID=UPI00080596C2|nr:MULTISPECIES: restriction endonuclease [unclassified Helicobacter]OBV28780.1 restriction endonuclease [Helicobacter sp. CLO-3]OHU85850.1 restriction endonuclease [Helicobacter sp. CLO-3]